MTQPTIGTFFSPGGKAAKFPLDAPGTTVEGVITRVHPPEPQVDFDTQQPIPGKLQIRIEVQTQQHDDNDDDGIRTLYVRGWMTGAIGDALRKQGVAEPEVGAKLAVTYTGTGPSKRPGLSGPKLFTASYTPSAGHFDPPAKRTLLDNGQAAPQQSVPQDAPIPADPPKGIDPQAWANMPHDAKQAIANTIAGMPPF
jgi:hypothetical protein